MCPPGRLVLPVQPSLAVDQGDKKVGGDAVGKDLSVDSQCTCSVGDVPTNVHEEDDSSDTESFESCLEEEQVHGNGEEVADLFNGIWDPVMDGLEEVAYLGRKRAVRMVGLSLPDARKIAGFVEFENHCKGISVRSVEVIARQKAGADLTGQYLNEHTHTRVLRRILALVAVGVKHVSEVGVLENCRIVCEKLMSQLVGGTSPKTINNHLLAYKGLLNRMHNFRVAGEGSFVASVGGFHLEACEAKIQLCLEEVRAQVVVSEMAHHFQDYWEALGRWVNEKEWVLFGRSIIERLQIVQERWSRKKNVLTLFMAMQSLLLMGLAVLCPTLRAQVYLNLKVTDYERGFFKITRDKTTVAAAATSGQGRAFRYLPVNKNLQPFVEFYIDHMRRYHVADKKNPFVFVTQSGKPVATVCTVREWCLNLSRKLVKKHLTLNDLRHLRCTHTVRALSLSKLPAAEKDAFLEAQADCMGHTKETMIQHYVIRNASHSARINGQLLDQLNDIIGF
jgi:hypothetical protein